jgi:zinc transport system substrate-binding protein
MKTRKLFTIISLILPAGLLLSSLSSCKTSQADIVTTMLPQYDFAKQIVQDRLTVKNILPPGAEVHKFDASSQDLIMIETAKLFIYTSSIIDTWITNPDLIGGENTIVYNMSESYEHFLDEHENHHEFHSILVNNHHDEIDDHDHDHDYIHFWVDPLVATHIIEEILQLIIQIDPENEDFYTLNATDYIEAIEQAYHEFDNYLIDNGLENSNIYYAGHDSMGLFAKRHHLNIVTLFPDFIPDEDLTSSQLITFTNAIKDVGTNYLFIEELALPKAANRIKAELARQNYELNLLELHGYHNLTLQDYNAGIGYADLYQRNIDNIKLALSNGL